MLALPFPPMRRADGNKLLGFRIDRAVGVPGGRQTGKRVNHHRQFSRRRRLERPRQARLRAEAQREMPFQQQQSRRLCETDGFALSPCMGAPAQVRSLGTAGVGQDGGPDRI